MQLPPPPPPPTTTNSNRSTNNTGITKTMKLSSAAAAATSSIIAISQTSVDIDNAASYHGSVHSLINLYIHSFFGSFCVRWFVIFLVRLLTYIFLMGFLLKATSKPKGEIVNVNPPLFFTYCFVSYLYKLLKVGGK